MTETQEILRKIASLRARLDRSSGLLRAADAEVSSQDEKAAADLKALEARVERSGREGDLLDGNLRPLCEDAAVLPPRLTARAMRLLHHGRDLLQSLKALAESPALEGGELGARGKLHRETSAMLQSVLRTVQSFPPAPSAQLRLCEGLESILEVVEERVRMLQAACSHEELCAARVDHLAALLRKLITGQSIRNRDWHGLTEDFWKEAQAATPLRFARVGTHDPFRFAAAQGMNTAQVLARVLIHETELHGQLHECILAALLHDVGMAYLPPELLSHPGPWSDAERRHMEKHAALGAQVLAKFFAPGSLIVEATQDHHERLDGTGYPLGRKEMQVSSFTRLLAVCDVYAAMCTGRPHRGARDTRTALTDTLLLADQGALDKFQAEKLLRLSFYPVGTVVELMDGAVGVVVMTHQDEKGLLQPSKPVLLLLAESEGQPLPLPRLLDLMREEERSILRTLPAEARLALLGQRFPQLV